MKRRRRFVAGKVRGVKSTSSEAGADQERRV